MQINLQFSEREYLRGKASEIRFSEQKTKFSPQKKFPFCLSMSKIDEPNAMELAPIAEARMIFER